MMDLLWSVIYSLAVGLLVWLLHSRIGEYPEPLPRSQRPKREITQALTLWALACSVSALMAMALPGGLDGPWRPRVCLSRSVGDDTGDGVSTTMVLDTGLGFRSAVWHQIAQLLCRLDEVYICDGCNRPYQRGIRKPRPDQDNFCPDCRKNSKAAKRLWAQRNREKMK